MAIKVYMERNPSYEHCIASKETWEKLCDTKKPIRLWLKGFYFQNWIYNLVSFGFYLENL